MKISPIATAEREYKETVFYFLFKKKKFFLGWMLLPAGEEGKIVDREREREHRT